MAITSNITTITSNTTKAVIPPTTPNLLQLYLTGQLWELDFIMLLPFIYIAWTKFLRNGFTLSFVIAEGESLREVAAKWFVGLDKEGQHINMRMGRDRKNQRTIFIDGSKVTYTDRFNKRHLIFPVGNTFAFQPFADEVLIPTLDKDIVDSISKDIKSGKLSSFMSKVKGEETIKEDGDNTHHIHPIKINLVTIIKFDSIRLFKYFFGSAMIARVEEARKHKENQISLIGVVLGLMIGLFIAIIFLSADPSVLGLQHVGVSTITTITHTTGIITTTTSHTTPTYINGTIP